jgi:hypothetical protein
MSNFWPKGFELTDTESPRQILETAQREWNAESSGVLTLVFQETKSESGNDMIIVHAKHVPSNRTVTLFSVIYRPNTPYPATIQPKDDILPNYLKKSYYKPGTLDNALVGSGILNSQGCQILNDWVSDAPAEFRKKLEEVFNLGIVKSEILSLVSMSGFQSATADVEDA